MVKTTWIQGIKRKLPMTRSAGEMLRCDKCNQHKPDRCTCNITEKCWICGKEKGQPPLKCNGHFEQHQEAAGLPLMDCTKCEHIFNDDHGYCYMFRRKPKGNRCGQFTPVITPNSTLTE